MTLPDGAESQQVKAEQPTAQHREFVATNLTAIGAGCGLARNMASNDSSDYNYSSVRMDHQTFFRYVEYAQGLVMKLTNFVFDAWYSVDQEAQELLSWADPSMIRRDWYFRELEHVAPSKEATATINLRNAVLLTAKEYFSKYGQDWREQMSQWKIEQEMLQGLVVEPVANPDEDAEDDEMEVTANTLQQQNNDDFAQVDSMQATALNGAQVTAAVDIVTKVSNGELPAETAIQMLVDFFQLPPEAARRMVEPATKNIA